MESIQRNLFDSELLIRKAEDGSIFIEGYAYKYDTLGNGYAKIANNTYAKEKIAKGAALRAIENNDIRMQFLHDPKNLLARSKAKTLTVKEDAIGLFYSVSLPNTQLGRDILEQISRQEIKGTSVGFSMRGAKYNFSKDKNGETIATLTDMNLQEISFVYDPYYESSSVEVNARSIENYYKEYVDMNKQEKISDLDINLLIAINKNHEKENSK